MCNIAFDYIVKKTPLVSIDLIIKNSAGKYLLNYRGHRPAKNSWFFFGGSIKKTQDIEVAFYSIISREFKSKLSVDFKNTRLTKVVTHKYLENRHRNVKYEINGIHYVVLCFELNAELSEKDIRSILNDYKSENDTHVLRIEWFDKENLLNTKSVHENVRNYFNLSPKYSI